MSRTETIQKIKLKFQLNQSYDRCVDNKQQKSTFKMSTKIDIYTG